MHQFPYKYLLCNYYIAKNCINQHKITHLR
nr:MAG TPA: hypothetical protein [Caudoviricetes sp.]